MAGRSGENVGAHGGRTGRVRGGGTASGDGWVVRSSEGTLGQESAIVSHAEGSRRERAIP